MSTAAAIADALLGLLYLAFAGILGWYVVRPQGLVERMQRMTPWRLRWGLFMLALACFAVGATLVFGMVAEAMIERIWAALGAPPPLL